VRGTSTALGSRAPPYRRVAVVYDQVYAWKDYAREARRVHALVRRYGPHPARRLLDVACGTGVHLKYLSRWYRVTGLDGSAPMLRVARERLPRVRFIRGAMQSFRLPDRFDIITCLFSSIGYVRSEVDLRRTLANFARHLTPGGIAIVEPWLTPREYREGSVHLGTYGTKSRPIARMNTAGRRGGRSIMDMHYLVGRDGRIRSWVERHNMCLFGARTMRSAFRSAGLDARRIPSKFTTHRGLYLATKPPTKRPPVHGSRGTRNPHPRRGPRRR
jgi:ubiquinone/menaquinone biosynthesis C-methylase UbiE